MTLNGINLIKKTMKPTVNKILSAICHCFTDEVGRPNSAGVIPQPHADDIAIDAFAAAMKEKMAAGRAKGRAGWNDPAACPNGTLARMLLDHVAKGDPVDVGNFAMMLFARGERMAPEITVVVETSRSPSFGAVARLIDDCTDKSLAAIKALGSEK